jgi:hypothetical protein
MPEHPPFTQGAQFDRATERRLKAFKIAPDNFHESK